MKTFYLTVGQKYRQEPHPIGLHPDGWARVLAPSYADAVRIAKDHCGTRWAWIYEEDEFTPHLFPRGEMMTLKTPSQPA